MDAGVLRGFRLRDCYRSFRREWAVNQQPIVEGSSLFASSCALIANLKIRRGDFIQAQEIADDLRATRIIGCHFAARIIEESIAAHSEQRTAA